MDLTVGTGPQYLVSKERLKDIVLGATAFPEDPAPKEIEQEIPLQSANEVEVTSNPMLQDISQKDTGRVPKYRQAKCEIREVNDPEMGQCLEIELIREGEVWDMEHEYVALKLKTPVKTTAKNAGIWIKGNGSWGNVDITKAQGWGPWATNTNLHMQWSGNQTLNFDGWNFIRYPYYDWSHKENNAVTGLVIALPRKALAGTEMQPVENLKVRIKKIILF